MCQLQCLPANQRKQESTKVSGGFSIRDLCSYCVVCAVESALAEGESTNPPDEREEIGKQRGFRNVRQRNEG